jgi:hypothetical protein
MTQRTRTAVSLLLLFGCCSTAELLREALMQGSPFQEQEEITHYDQQRFEPLKLLLQGHSEIGFIEDEYLKLDILPEKHGLAQYVLAPVLVLNEPGRPLVIGNFRRRGLLPPAPPGYTYRLLYDLGNGVQLLQTEPQ